MKKQLKVALSVILSFALLFVGLVPGAGSSVVNAAQNGQGTIEYDEYLNPGKVLLKPDMTISDSTYFADGQIKFAINGGSASGETLALDPSIEIPTANGLVTNVGNSVYLDGVEIGKVNTGSNGVGTDLQIDMTSTLLPNGDFEQGSGSNVPDWTFRASDGMPNQIWLGSLAAKTQGREYADKTPVEPVYKMTGPNNEYSYITDVNYINVQGSRNIYQMLEGTEKVVTVPGTTINELTSSTNGTKALKLGYSSATITNDGKDSHGTAFRADAMSDNYFVAKTGDQLAFDWKADGSDDNYEVYGFIVDEGGNHTEIMYGRGSTQPWIASGGVIPHDGLYKFRFVAGSYDATNGFALGAALEIDNIRIRSVKINSLVMDAIAQMVTYENTIFRPLPSPSERLVNVTVASADGVATTTSGQAIIDLIGEPQLELVTAVVEEATPNQMTLTFNLPVGSDISDLNLDDLIVNGHKIKQVISVNDEKVVVELEGPISAGELTLEYDAAKGNVESVRISENKLQSITAASNINDPDVVKNNVTPLELIRVTTVPSDPTLLKLKFNKAISDGGLTPEDVLAGFTVGGNPVDFVSINVAGDEIVVKLADPYEADDQLVYVKNDGNIADAKNPANKLDDIGQNQLPIVNGKLQGVGLSNNGTAISIDPVFDPNKNNGDGDGYWAYVPNDVTDVKLSPAPFNPLETVTKITLNGTEVDSANNGWDNIGELKEGINEILVQVYDKEDPTTMLEEYTIFIVRATPKLSSLVPSSGSLEPVFDLETEDYKLNTGASSITLTPSAIDPKATIEISVNGGIPISVLNGAVSQALPLNIGKNLIDVKITDSKGDTKQYTVEVWRYAYSGGGNVGGNVETITVDVVIGGDQATDITKLEIKRTKSADGKILDQVIYTPEKAQETVDKAKAANMQIARIVIPDVKDVENVLTVDVPVNTLRILQNSGIYLEIYSDHAAIRLPKAALAGLNSEFYFRFQPVREANVRSELEGRTKTASVVRDIAEDKEIVIVSRPMTIETNLSNREATVTLPLLDAKLPTEASAKQKYLKQLWVYVENENGEMSIIKGTAVKMANGEMGLQFATQFGKDKSSTFTVIYIDKEFKEHNLYVKGYPDGTFKPSKAVTRAEMATLLARSGAAKATTSGTGFPDLKASHWAAAFVKQTQASGLMQGYPDGEFKSEQGITRTELAAIAFNYLGLKREETSVYSDVKSGNWAFGIISALSKVDVMVGYPDGTFKPNQKVTRAEAVTVINRLVGRGPLYGVAQHRWPDVKANYWAYNDIEEASQDHAYEEREAGGETKVTQ